MRPLVWLLAKPRVVYEVFEKAGSRILRSRFGMTKVDLFLIISNHVTLYDGALVLYALPGRVRRRVAAAMSGEMLLDYRQGARAGELGARRAGAGRVLAADGAVQCVSAAECARFPAKLCPCGRGDGPRLLGADFS